MKIEIIRSNNSFPLEVKTPGSAGYDLHACLDELVVIDPGTASVLIPTGIKIHIKDPGVSGWILPRSGKGHRDGLVLGNGIGLIDSDYTGELMISLCVRPGHSPVTIFPGDSIAQLVFIPTVHPVFVDVEEFSAETERGEGGFGSTDHK